MTTTWNPARPACLHWNTGTVCEWCGEPIVVDVAAEREWRHLLEPLAIPEALLAESIPPRRAVIGAGAGQEPPSLADPAPNPTAALLQYQAEDR